MIGVAIVIAVGEPRPDFSDVTRPDRPIAPHTQGSLAGRPFIHQYKSHVAPPDVRSDLLRKSQTWRNCRVLFAAAIVRRQLAVDVTICDRPPDGS